MLECLELLFIHDVCVSSGIWFDDGLDAVDPNFAFVQAFGWYVRCFVDIHVLENSIDVFVAFALRFDAITVTPLFHVSDLSVSFAFVVCRSLMVLFAFSVFFPS